MPLSPEAHRLVEELERRFPAVGTEVTDPLEARRLAGLVPRPAGPDMASVEDFVVEVSQPAGVVRVRLYRPEEHDEDQPLTVFLHGGGWVQGDLESHDAMCRRLAVGTRLPVLAVDYRLAPEHPFPTAVEDVAAVFRWVTARASDLGIDAGRIGCLGDSAGANLAVGATLLARDQGAALPRFHVLLYPATDSRQQSGSYDEFGTSGAFLTRAKLAWYWDLYLGGADGGDPRASPLRADLRGLPPTFVVVAECDPLRDEGEAYARALARRGGQVLLRRYEGVHHGFVGAEAALATARRAAVDVHDWIRAEVVAAPR